jgi:hypothetical protein
MEIMIEYFISLEFMLFMEKSHFTAALSVYMVNLKTVR